MNTLTRERFNSVIKLTLFLTLFSISHLTFADNELLWKQIYYGAISKTTGQPSSYCNISTPGIFIGTVNGELKNGALTNKSIRLSDFVPHQIHKNNSYYIIGTVIESWNQYTDSITYNLHKSTEAGKTTGTWTNSQCTGLYLGYVIKK